ncbi:MAG: hypothetical protein AAF638_07185 [Pseudomonadota bacterium]
MTTIITRLYQDYPTADGVVQALMEKHFTPSMIDVICGGIDAPAALKEAKVPAASHAAFAQAIASGNALVVVRAPFGAATLARDALAETASIGVEGASESTYVAEDLDPAYRNASLLAGNPRLMSSGVFPSLRRGRSLIAQMFGEPLMGKQVNLEKSIWSNRYMANFPIRHLKTKRVNLQNSIWRNRYMANFPIPHLRDRKPDLETTIWRDRYMADFPIPHLVNKL